MALGIPIPFSSLGMIIPEVFLPYQMSDSERFEKSFDNGYTGRVTEDFLTALHVNALQIQCYLMTYSQQSGDFPSDVFNSLQAHLYHSVQLHKNTLKIGDHKPSQEELTRIAAAYISYMKEVKQMCQSVWAKFDNVSITEGLILLILSVAFVPLMLIDVQNGIQALKEALPCGFVCGLAVSIAVSLLINFAHLEFSFSGLVSVSLSFLLYSLALVIVMFIVFSRTTIFRVLKSKLEGGLLLVVNNVSILQLLSIVCTFLYGVAMLSNSFVLYEGDMVSFFLQSLLVCFAVRSLQMEFKGKTNLRLGKEVLIQITRTAAPYVGMMVCVRTVKIFYACRDLQIQDGCVSTTFIHALPVAYEFLGWLAKWRMMLSCVSIALIPAAFVLVVQQNAGARHLNSWIHYMGKLGFPAAVLCVIGFWLLLCCSQSVLESLSHWQHVALPWIVYLISTVAMTLSVVRPYRRTRRVLTMSCEENSVDTKEEDNAEREREFTDGHDGAHRPRHRKQKYKEQGESIDHSSSRDVDQFLRPSVTAIISLTNLFLLLALWIPIALVLNDGIALSAVIMAAQVGLTIRSLKGKESGIIFHTNSISVILCYSEGIIMYALLVGTSWPVCVMWSLMSCQFFFGFGHHATVTSLRFEAGFVGLHGEIHKYNLPFAAALVGLNTLGSQVYINYFFSLFFVVWEGHL